MVQLLADAVNVTQSKRGADDGPRHATRVRQGTCISWSAHSSILALLSKHCSFDLFSSPLDMESGQHLGRWSPLSAKVPNL